MREVRTERTYRHIILNKCSRGEGVLLNELVTRVARNQMAFEVENPNLSCSVQATYELSPMTDAEAATALDAALERCKNYQP